MPRELLKVTIKSATSIEKAQLLAVGLFSDTKPSEQLYKHLNEKLDGAIDQLKKLGDFDGKKGRTAVLYSGGKIKADRLLLVGLGESKDASYETLRQAVCKAAKEAVGLKVSNAAMFLHSLFDEKKFDAEQIGRIIAEAVHFGIYKYDEFITSEKNGRPAAVDITIVEPKEQTLKKISAGIKIGDVIGQTQNFARTLANRPANMIYPAELAEIAKRTARQTAGLSCTILNESQLKIKKMGGILAVGSGSEHRPCMIVLKYNPGKAVNKKPLGLVGKAVCFDSGGLSIKPAQNMDEMKMDMSGGAAVLASMQAIAKLKLPVRVFAVICAVENIPSATSYRPGDIITTYSGKTVEVQNTDAEGRLILADGLHYAKQLGCEPMIDIATLTGACMVALGTYKAGLMGNNEKLIEQIKQASQQSGEPVWHLPCGDEYLEEMKSKIADLKNIGTRNGGACTGASFIGEFADKTPWAHIDMAPVTQACEPMKKFADPHSRGFGVRLFVQYVINMVK